MAKKQKHRSPAYPSIDLKRAVGLVRKIYPAAQHSLGGEVIAEEWGYKNQISASPYLAAMKYYGFLKEEKEGEDRLFKLTESALDIAVDDEEKSSEGIKAVIEAAIKPKLHRELWDKWGGQLPPDSEISRYLRRERNFNPAKVARFISIYKSTIEYASNFKAASLGDDFPVDTSNNGNGPKTPPTEVQVGSYVQWTSQGVHQFPEPAKITRIDKQPDGTEFAYFEEKDGYAPMPELTIEQPETEINLLTPSATPPRHGTRDEEPHSGAALVRYELDEGTVRLEWPSELSKDSVEEFEYWIEGLVKRAKRKAGLTKIKIEEEN